jgi:hypothetical protein
MKRQGHFLAVMVVCAVAFLPGLRSQAQITPVGDSYTNTADPTTIYGAKTLLDVDGASQITYIQFNLASIPATANISQATLKLYVNSVTTAGSFNVDYVNGSWSESTLDVSNAPALGTSIASDVSVTTADKNQYILINLTSAVQAWLGGSEANNGIALVANSTFNATFDSKENTTTSHPPELDIAYAGGEGTITGVTTAPGSGLNGGGTSGTLNLGLTNACATNQVLQWSGSMWACSNAGTGTITGVTAGTALTGGGTSGNVTLNLNTSQIPLLAGANVFTGNNLFTSAVNFNGLASFANAAFLSSTFTGNALFQPQAPTDAIDAYTAGPGKTAVVGIENATSGGSYGVWARTSDASGAGVKGTNVGGTGGVGVYGTGDIGLYGTSSTGNNAIVANGNASQSRAGGGWVKAMVFINGLSAPYSILRCFNSALSGAAASTPPCGFTLTEISVGEFVVDFGFEVDDRFYATGLAALDPNAYGDPVHLFVNAVGGSGEYLNQLLVTALDSSNPNFGNFEAYVIVF